MTTNIEILLCRLANPAKRAVQSTGATSLEDLATNSVMEIANLHGIGPNAMQKIARVIREYGLTFKVP